MYIKGTHVKNIVRNDAGERVFFLGKGIRLGKRMRCKKCGNSVGCWGKHMLNKSLGVRPMWKKAVKGLEAEEISRGKMEKGCRGKDVKK